MTPLLVSNSFNNYWHRSPWKSKKVTRVWVFFKVGGKLSDYKRIVFRMTIPKIWNFSIDWDFFTELLIKPRPPSYTWHTVAPDCRGVAWWTWRKRGQGRSHARPAGQRLSDIGSVAQHTQLSLANYGQGFTLHWNPGPARGLHRSTVRYQVPYLAAISRVGPTFLSICLMSISNFWKRKSSWNLLEGRLINIQIWDEMHCLDQRMNIWLPNHASILR